MFKLHIIIFFLFSSPNSIYSQTTLSGNIYFASTDSLLSHITVTNISNKTATISNEKGSYRVFAGENDTVIFSGVGFKSDTIEVTFDMLLFKYHAEMFNAYVTLDPVSVTRNYKTDSLERRNQYQHIFDNTTNITGGNRPVNGFGISLSPFSYFSAKATAQRKLKKRLLLEEKESLIDYTFTPKLVARLTGLSGDSLRLFLFTYRPSYKFCRKTNQTGIILYINDCFKEFKEPAIKK